MANGCPGCGSAGTLRRDLDGDYGCWMCGHVEYATPPLPVVNGRNLPSTPRPDLRRNGDGHFPTLCANLPKSPLHSLPKVYNERRRVVNGDNPAFVGPSRVPVRQLTTLHSRSAAGLAQGLAARRPDASLCTPSLERMAELTSQPKQHNSGSAAPPASGEKKASGFGARVVKAREKKELKRTGLSFPMHAAACSVQHPEPYKYADWPAACQKAADTLWNRIAAIEKGKARDPELEAELAQRLGIAAPKPSEKVAAPAKAAKPAVTVAIIKKHAAKLGGEFNMNSMRLAILGYQKGAHSSYVYWAMRKLVEAHPETFARVGASGHKYTVRETLAADGDAPAQPEKVRRAVRRLNAAVATAEAEAE